MNGDETSRRDSGASASLESVGGVAVDSDDSEEQIRNPDTLMVI